MSKLALIDGPSETVSKLKFKGRKLKAAFTQVLQLSPAGKLRRLGFPNQIVNDSNWDFNKFGRRLPYKLDSKTIIELTIVI